MPRRGREKGKSVVRFQDEVYREMFRLEGGRPGAEMGLALALLRAWVALEDQSKANREWLTAICPVCLKLIQESLERFEVDLGERAGECDPDCVS